MGKARPVLPDVMYDSATGKTMRRGIRPVTYSYKGESITVDVPGYYPDDDSDDGVLVGEDLKPGSAALDALKRRVEGIPPPADIRRLRKKLKLTQRDAGALFRVGENAFNKYERGIVQPSGPTVQLMKLLDRHPELIEDLRDPKAAE
jgi:HTH-type transcriptional regulator / antitoxin MqsA